MDPDNRTAYTMQWNGNVQRTFGTDYLVEVAYTGSHSYNEHKRFNINQAQPGTTPIETRVPYPAFQSAILYSSDGGWASFNGVSFRLDKRYSDGLFFLGSYQLSKNRDNGSGEIEANDTALRVGSECRHRLRRATISVTGSQASFGYELPFGPGKPWLSNGGAAAYAFGGWQIQGIMRFAVRIPVHDLLHERLPVRIVRPAAREPRHAGETSESSTIRRPTAGSTRLRTRFRRSARRALRAATPCAAPERSRSTCR